MNDRNGEGKTKFCAHVRRRWIQTKGGLCLREGRRGKWGKLSWTWCKHWFPHSTLFNVTADSRVILDCGSSYGDFSYQCRYNVSVETEKQPLFFRSCLYSVTSSSDCLLPDYSCYCYQLYCRTNRLCTSWSKRSNGDKCDVLVLFRKRPPKRQNGHLATYYAVFTNLYLSYRSDKGSFMAIYTPNPYYQIPKGKHVSTPRLCNHC